jgi:GT2 family glycosyltransferase
MNQESNLPMVSIIINSYRDLDKLRQCLEALNKLEYDNKEIIIVTYGIPLQNIRKALKKMNYNKLILLKKDYGLPAQRNIGFKFADPSSRYVLFIDDDVVLDKTALSNLVRVAETFPDIGLAQPLLVAPDGFIDCAGAYIDFLGYSYNPFRGLPLSLFIVRKEFYEISYGAGACLLLRADIFRNDKFFKPFDPSFYFNYEDVDLALRTWMKGYKVVCIPSAKAIHKRGRTLMMKLSPAHLIYLNTRNKFVTVGSILGFKYLVLFIFLEILKSLYLFRFNYYHALATISGILYGIKNFNIVVFRRKLLNDRRNNIKKLLVENIIIKPNTSVLISEFKRHYD